jgi:Zn-dependent protease
LGFLFIFIVSAVTAGIGFLLHEIGHKLLAQRYRCWAEFRSDDQMLILMLITSVFGFLFAAPGAVRISGNINTEKNGKISALGPLINMGLAMIFYVIHFISPFQLIADIAFYGAYINAFIGAFNMIPFGNFDGVKILAWNKLVYGSMVVLGMILVFIAYL